MIRYYRVELYSLSSSVVTLLLLNRKTAVKVLALILLSLVGDVQVSVIYCILSSPKKIKFLGTLEIVRRQMNNIMDCSSTAVLLRALIS